MSEFLERHEHLMRTTLDYAAVYLAWRRDIRRSDHPDAAGELAALFPDASRGQIDRALECGDKLARAVHGNPNKPPPNEQKMLDPGEIVNLCKKIVPGLSDEAYQLAMNFMLEINR